MMSLPDGPMQSLLNHARKYSTDEPSGGRASSSASSSGKDDYEHDENRRSSISYPEGYSLDRRLSEAGVNRRPSAAQILTEDTDSFIIGETVYVDGVQRGVFLEEALGKNDGAVGNVRYFQCEPRHGVFARLFRLTREPIEGADDVLSQMKKYGYEIIETPHHHRRGSIGSSGGGSRRGSMSIDDHHHHHPHHLHHLNPRRGSIDRGSLSPRQPRTPETRRTSVSVVTSDTTGCAMHDPHRRGSGVGLSGDHRRTSLIVPERRGSGAFIPPLSPRGRRVNPGKSPLASPRTSRSNLGISKPIEMDPDVNKLISEARRLSMGGSGRRGSEIVDHLADEVRRNLPYGARRPSTDITGRRSSSNPRRTSESSSSSSNGGYARSPLLHRNSRSDALPSSKFGRKTSASLGLGARRSSSSDNNNNSLNNSSSSNNNNKYAVGKRRPSSDLVATELLNRRQSEAGLRRPSTSDIVLNERTSNLMVGMPVYVDGTKPGRIAYIGDVHFAQGIMAGVHLDRPQGKNNGSIGGIMYFQCEPKRGIFSQLHRLTVSPLIGNGSSSNERIY
ncbi:CLIP1 [Lepeophtheirus salmonis]|uniref:CLIP1 n=1 Tax=Lepeophtheirus salmonis TaxID=72036 RepID=A0A7R8D1K5_LEPSM|nr:CLIP1 [Lepeophtheirus salmonis]CAF2996590.1 CLIP1 [Lepeophtheirus salmonis]